MVDKRPTQALSMRVCDVLRLLHSRDCFWRRVFVIEARKKKTRLEGAPSDRLNQLESRLLLR